MRLPFDYKKRLPFDYKRAPGRLGKGAGIERPLGVRASLRQKFWRLGNCRLAIVLQEGCVLIVHHLVSLRCEMVSHYMLSPEACNLAGLPQCALSDSAAACLQKGLSLRRG